MKTLKLTCFFFILSLITYAQAPNYLWSAGLKGAGTESFSSIVSDHNGNVITTGIYKSDTLRCGSTTLVNADPSTTTFDIYLVKYDSSGTVLWAKTFGNTAVGDYSSRVFTDSNDNIILTGSSSYYATISFGSISVYAQSFIAKFDPSGNVIWAKGILNTSSILAGSVDANDNIIVSGSYADNYIDLGSGVSSDTTVVAYDNSFFAKYNSSGTPQWVKRARSTYDSYFNNVATDATGNIFISGYFSDSLDLGTDTLYCPVFGEYNTFLAKYDATGNLNWLKTGGIITGVNDMPKICIDGDGNVLIGTSFTGSSSTFGGIVFNNSYPGTSTADSYIIKYDPAGALLWTRQATGPGDFTLIDFCTDAQNNIFLYAPITGNSTIDTLPVSLQYDNVGVVKLDAGGNARWLKEIPGDSQASAKCITTDPHGNILVSGVFEQPFITFDNADTLFVTAPAASTTDVFTAKINAVAYPPCFASYTTTYDSTSNIFSLTVDPGTVAIAASYLWDFGDGTTSTLAAPTHAYATDSIYNVCMTVYDIYGESCTYCHNIGIDSSGTVNRSGFSLAVIPQVTTSVAASSGTGISSSIFPNPSTGAFSISSTDDVTGIAITNVLGETIYSITTGLHSQTRLFNVDLSSQPNGIYFVVIRSGQQTNTQRICINK